jgi:hypothetical protein
MSKLLDESNKPLFSKFWNRKPNDDFNKKKPEDEN